jgi:hypothetical protein
MESHDPMLIGFNGLSTEESGSQLKLSYLITLLSLEMLMSSMKTHGFLQAQDQTATKITFRLEVLII